LLPGVKEIIFFSTAFDYNVQSCNNRLKRQRPLIITRYVSRILLIFKILLQKSCLLIFLTFQKFLLLEYIFTKKGEKRYINNQQESN